MKAFNKINKAMGGWLRQTIFDPWLYITLLISVLISTLGNEQILRNSQVSVGMAQVQIGTTLLGIVLAGFAILIAFLNKDYIKLLEKVDPGFDADLWPFIFTGFLAVLCASFGMTLIIMGDPISYVFRTIFLFSLWSFSYLLLNMFQLVRFVAGHARNRVKQIQKDKSE